jgi:hypothetical protein
MTLGFTIRFFLLWFDPKNHSSSTGSHSQRISDLENQVTRPVTLSQTDSLTQRILTTDWLEGSEELDHNRFGHIRP